MGSNKMQVLILVAVVITIISNMAVAFIYVK